MKAVIVGDSQGVGLETVLGPVLSRHGYELDTAKSWTSNGANLDSITQHAVQAGPADLAIVFSGGGNDPLSLTTNQANYRAKLVTLVGTLRFSGVQEIVLVGPMKSDDPSVTAMHDAARAVQGQGIPGARWIDGYLVSEWTPHPVGNPTHWDRNGYAAIALELEKAIWSSTTKAVIGLVGTLTFLGGLGMLLMEGLYDRAASSTD